MYQSCLHPLRMDHLAGAVQTHHTLLPSNWKRSLLSLQLHPACLIADVHQNPVSYVRRKTKLIRQGIPKMHWNQWLQLGRGVLSWGFQHQNQIHTCYPHQRTRYLMRGYPMDWRAWEENGRLPVRGAVAGWNCQCEGSCDPCGIDYWNKCRTTECHQHNHMDLIKQGSDHLHMF